MILHKSYSSALFYYFSQQNYLSTLERYLPKCEIPIKWNQSAISNFILSPLPPPPNQKKEWDLFLINSFTTISKQNQTSTSLYSFYFPNLLLHTVLPLVCFPYTPMNHSVQAQGFIIFLYFLSLANSQEISLAPKHTLLNDCLHFQCQEFIKTANYTTL